MPNKKDALDHARRRVHAAVDELFNAMADAIALVGDLPKPVTSPPPAANGAFDLETAIKQATTAGGRRPPIKQERQVNDHDRQVVVAVRKSTEDKRWPGMSKRLQANLKLRPQQVAGILAAANRMQ